MSSDATGPSPGLVQAWPPHSQLADGRRIKGVSCGVDSETKSALVPRSEISPANERSISRRAALSYHEDSIFGLSRYLAFSKMPRNVR